jgi:7-cyano-7-deazaguanine synthase
VKLHTPLMNIDKAETWRLAKALGGDALVAIVLEETMSCYRGERAVRHAWGYGCGTCPACVLRAAGYARYRGEAA